MDTCVNLLDINDPYYLFMIVIPTCYQSK